jgi:hypothetical protein
MGGYINPAGSFGDFDDSPRARSFNEVRRIEAAIDAKVDQIKAAMKPGMTTMAQRQAMRDELFLMVRDAVSHSSEDPEVIAAIAEAHVGLVTDDPGYKRPR